ncbi:MAG: chemotaxis protein CheW [Oleiphilaceae bacterium]|nr:chemotaxis protein CheW [Oleiphilaceae bacterium]
MKSTRDTDYAKPDTALAGYLDDLLHTAVTKAREPEDELPLSVPESRLTQTEPAPVATPVAQPVTRVLRPSAPESAVPAQPHEAVGEISQAQAAVPQAQASSPPLRPDWSERPFECLLFTVAGLQLAVPLVLLGAIHRIDRKVKPIPGRPRWYMGMLPGEDRNLRVVDTGEWVMAERVGPETRENYRFVIRLDNSEWALACDDVAQSFTLAPDEVRWRTGRSKRPWLAGTVIKHMCALIDVGTMASMLARAEREHRLALE